MAKPKANPLAGHAKDRDTLEFSEPVLHGRIRFGKGEVVRFEDPAAAAYFDIGFNGTEFTDKEPTRTIGNDELNFDPDAEGETIDLETRINGRQDVKDGATITEAVKGLPASGTGALNVKDVVSRTEG
jgi:hypothetical protein